jgi:hypothetical protein
MKDVLDEMKVLLKAAREAEIEEQKRVHRQFGLDASDLRAFSNIHPAQQGDKVRVANAPLAEAPKVSNWQEPAALKTPYVAEVDRIALAFARKEKEQALRERIKELTEEHERLTRLAAAREGKA